MEGKTSVNFTVQPDDSTPTERTYANFCAIQHSPFDFTLTFCDMPPLGEKEIEQAQRTHVVKAPIQARLVVPVQVVPGLIAALQENLRIYNEAFAANRGPMN